MYRAIGLFSCLALASLATTACDRGASAAASSAVDVHAPESESGEIAQTQPGPSPTAASEPPACSHVPGVCCLAIQPLGEVPDELVDGVSEALRGEYGLEVRALDAVPLPDSAWYEPRRRWRAERLLDFLEPRLPAGCDRILGVTTQDISTTKGEHRDWGILGLADLPGVASVISYFRCRRRVADVPPAARLQRVAIHEVGHSLGLPHCPTYGCYMEDAGGTVETIDRETFLCEVCQRRIGMRRPEPTQ